MHEKDFVGWHTHKQSIEEDTPRPTFNDREIWWCSIGVNIGHEMDGKNRLYNRPIPVIKNFNSRIFWGVALTTKGKNDPHYFPITFKKGKEYVTQYVMLSHLRLYDTKRLLSHKSRTCTLSDEQFVAVKKALKELLQKKLRMELFL